MELSMILRVFYIGVAVVAFAFCPWARVSFSMHFYPNALNCKDSQKTLYVAEKYKKPCNHSSVEGHQHATNWHAWSVKGHRKTTTDAPKWPDEADKRHQMEPSGTKIATQCRRQNCENKISTFGHVLFVFHAVLPTSMLRAVYH
jgi:hypothetical protein